MMMGWKSKHVEADKREPDEDLLPELENTKRIFKSDRCFITSQGKVPPGYAPSRPHRSVFRSPPRHSV